jgi:hypothetical protein
MAGQEQIRKLLINDFGFELISTKLTGFGERILLRAENGLEAQLGVYRVCFYGGAVTKTEETEQKSDFPAARHPLCFDIDHKSEIKSYLEKKLGVKEKPKRKVKARNNAPTLFEMQA